MRTINRIISSLFAVFIYVAVSPLFGANRNECDWQDKMRVEKIAYLTAEMNLSPDEAEKFWPIYNNMENDRRAYFEKVMQSFKALDEGLNAGKSERELSVLLNNYVNAVKESRCVEAKYTPLFTKVISVEKVAKLFIGEEEFRRQQINRWNADKRK